MHSESNYGLSRLTKKPKFIICEEDPQYKTSYKHIIKDS